MSSEIKTEFKIPDFWFDFCSRFLPGLTFVSSARCFLLQIKNIPSIEEIFALIFCGYVFALLTQPFSSFLVESIENKMGENTFNDLTNRQFIRYVQRRLGDETRTSLIISKMHGEINFFVQLFVLGTIFLILQICFFKVGYIVLYTNLLFLILAIVNSFEVANRRWKRVVDIYDTLE